MLSRSKFKSSFQDEEAETVKKPMFVSPFQRYKCVIPMIAELEAKEREKQLKEEEEKRLSEVVKEDNVDQAEINKSKVRVYEHFKQVSQPPSEVVEGIPKNKKKKKKKKNNPQLVLGQAHGRKRKKESDIVRENANQGEEGDNNFCTPTPSLDTRVLNMPKRVRQEMQSAIEERRVQENIAQVQGDKSIQPVVKSIR